MRKIYVKVIGPVIVTVSLCMGFNGLAAADSYTGQCPAVSEVQVQPGTVTVNGQPETGYMYSAFTSHNGIKMFTSFKLEKSKVAVQSFTNAYIDRVFGAEDIAPVACQYQLANGGRLILVAMDAVGEFEDIKSANGNWNDSGTACQASDPSGCQWENTVNVPSIPHQH
jgi:hypothetical protein